jgi:hypothetical protein
MGLEGTGKERLFFSPSQKCGGGTSKGLDWKGWEGIGMDWKGRDWIGLDWFFSKLKHARASNANIDSQTDRNIANNYSQRPDGQPDEQVREGVEGHHRQTKEGR